MANKKRRSRLKDRRPVVHDFQVSRELAYTLAEDYNGYAQMTDELPILEEEWVFDRLTEAFNPTDVDLFISDPFARGVIMGQLAFLKILETTPDDQA
jgi:uncharacterized protein YjgD (DUF1641 family)